MNAEFIAFLINDLALSNADIDLALRNRKLDNDPLPMLLWQYGLVSIDQLASIFDWLATKKV